MSEIACLRQLGTMCGMNKGLPAPSGAVSVLQKEGTITDK